MPDNIIQFRDYAKPRGSAVAVAARHDGAEVIELAAVAVDRAPLPLLDSGSLVCLPTEIPAM